MKNRVSFCVGLTLIGVISGWIWIRQDHELAAIRLSSFRNENVVTASRPNPLPQTKSDQAEQAQQELMKLRAEVGALRRELRLPDTIRFVPDENAEEWALVHSGHKPSDQPDFTFFTQITNAGNASPSAALATLNYVMRNQQREPITDTRMKEIYDLPDDYDSPDARYSINLGEGMGNEIGYRIVDETRLTTNEVRLTLDFERPDGSSFRRNRILVERNALWRVKPAGLKREKVGD